MKYIKNYRLISLCSFTIIMAVQGADAPISIGETIDWSGSESSAPLSLEPSHEFGKEGDAIHDSLRVPNNPLEKAPAPQEPLQPLDSQLDQGLPAPGLTTQMDPAVTEQAVVEKDIPSPISVAAPVEDNQPPQAATQIVLKSPISEEQAEQKYDIANAPEALFETPAMPVESPSNVEAGSSPLEIGIPDQPVLNPSVIGDDRSLSIDPARESSAPLLPASLENKEAQPMTVSPVLQNTALPMAPAAVSSASEFKEDAVAHQDEQPTIDEVEGIDTVNLAEPQGNWLFKRIWWERAEQKYEKIRKRVSEILESRMKFFTQRSDLDKNVFEPFYLEIGLAGGELQGRLQEYIESFKSQRASGQPLDSQKRELLAKAQEELAALEQLQKEIMAVSQLNQNVDKAIDRLLEQINTVRQYEQDAWLKFKEIARVLSEKTARELFFQMDVTSKNIHDIQLYLDGAFTQHFNDVVEAGKQQIAKIRNSLSLLKDKGIDIKQYFEALKMPQKQVVPQAVDEDEDEDEVVAKGFIGGIIDSVWSGIKGIGSFVVSIVRWPYDLIVGAPAPANGSDDTSDED